MTLETKLVGDKQLVLTRAVSAPPDRVYRAHTEATLVRQWMSGAMGYVVADCTYDARPGGSFPVVWEGEAAEMPDFEVTGEFLALDPPHRIEHVERMHLPDMTTSDSHIVTEFAAHAAGTLMTMTMTYESRDARDEAIATGMTEGMEAFYLQLDTL
ncbi:SRPBCC domain-containing protein [Nioella aestuarii]|uniref:SRPBCC domain-containing protein n=1 Tax=Nioella aestuarii TaxID=1662864 RepID=UPI003D7FDC90